MTKYLPLKFNPESANIYQTGGFELSKDWWMIMLAIIVIVIIVIAAVTISGSNNSNVKSSSITISKKTNNGEEVYYKEVDGEEQELTEAEKLEYDIKMDQSTLEENQML